MGLCVSGCVQVSLGVLGGLLRYFGVSLIVIVIVIVIVIICVLMMFFYLFLAFLRIY